MNTVEVEFCSFSTGSWMLPSCVCETNFSSQLTFFVNNGFPVNTLECKRGHSKEFSEITLLRCGFYLMNKLRAAFVSTAGLVAMLLCSRTSPT